MASLWQVLDGVGSLLFLQCAALACISGGAAVAFLDLNRPSYRFWTWWAGSRLLLAFPAISFFGLAILTAAIPPRLQESAAIVAFSAAVLLGLQIAAIWLLPRDDETDR